MANQTTIRRAISWTWETRTSFCIRATAIGKAKDGLAYMVDSQEEQTQ
jgi:hypothetical protein